MLKHELLTDKGILIARPGGPLSSSDFAGLSKDADRYIDKHERLNGLIICAESFPGWENLEGMISHFRFVRDHHRKIGKVAFVSDSDVLSLLPKLAGHFISAEIRHFRADEEEKAIAWAAD